MGLEQQQYSKRQNWKLANVPALKCVTYFFLLSCPEYISLEGQVPNLEYSSCCAM